MRHCVNITISLVMAFFMTACAVEEEPKDPIIHIHSKLQDAIVYIDRQKVGYLFEGALTVTTEAGEREILIEALSDDNAWIYSGRLKVYAGVSSESSFDIPYTKRSTQRHKEQIIDIKTAKKERHAFNMKKNAHLMYLDQNKKLYWQNESYSAKEIQAYNNSQTFKKMGSYSYAQNYCKELRIAELKDWRLPTKDELRNLFKQRFKLAHNVKSIFWSSSNFYKRPSHAWHIDFNKGNTRHGDKQYKFYIRCVRDNRP